MLKLLITEEGREAQRGSLTCPGSHSQRRSRKAHPGKASSRVCAPCLPPSLSLTGAHPFLPSQKGPACIPGVTWAHRGPMSHPETPPSRSDWLPRDPPAPCFGHGALGNGVGRERVRVQPNSFLPSLQGREGEPGRDTGDLMRFGNKHSLVEKKKKVCIIIVISTIQKIKK